MNDNIKALGCSIPLGAVIFLDGVSPISEYAEKNEIEADSCCVTVACDNHFEGLLPANIPKARNSAVYTKRLISISDSDGSPVMNYAHMSRSEFLTYFQNSVLDELNELPKGEYILLGGTSWQGLCLAKLASQIPKFKGSKHLIISELNTNSVIEQLKKSLNNVGCEYSLVSVGASKKMGRENLQNAVFRAVESIRDNYAGVMDPRSSTSRLAEQLALLQGYPMSHVPRSAPVMTSVSHKEIETWGRLVFDPNELAMLNATRANLSDQVQPSALDVFLLGASALEYFTPLT